MRRFPILASLLFSFCFHSPAHSLTLSEIRSKVRIEIQDNPTNSSFRRYSDTVLTDLINEGQREVVNATWLSMKTTSYILTRNVTYYTLPTDLLAITQVYYTRSGFTNELAELSQKSLYNDNPSWDRNTGVPDSYWVSNSTLPQSQESAPLRISYIPIPTSQSTGTVLIWFTSTVEDLSADSDVPWDNRRMLYSYHYALVYYAAARIKQTERKMDELQGYQARFENYVATMKARLAEMPNYTPGIQVPGIR